MKPSQASILLGLVSMSGAELFHTLDGDGYVTVLVKDHTETHPIRSRAFRRWLARLFYNAEGMVANAQAVQDALGVLEGQAQHDGPQHFVSVRVAGADDAIYLDLADAGWQAVKITAAGWEVIAVPPVKFRRARGMLALPVPEPGASIEALRTYVNVDPDGWVLMLACLIAAMRPSGPYPVLNLLGEQGTAKSTTARVLRALIDPNRAPVRSEPRDARDLMIAANNGWIINLDNISGLPTWLSDALCRLATGGGFATRELYENAEEVIFEAQRPVILNGIAEVATRSDLLDRSVVVTLPRISDDNRKAESEFWADFEAERPFILGALLDAVSLALRDLRTVRLDRLPGWRTSPSGWSPPSPRWAGSRAASSKPMPVIGTTHTSWSSKPGPAPRSSGNWPRPASAKTPASS